MSNTDPVEDRFRDYEPSPADLSAVKLDPAMELIVPKLAKQFHETWAKCRRKGPSNINYYQEYDKLPDEAKEENCANARLALQILLMHRFQIETPREPGTELAPEDAADIEALKAKLERGAVVDRSELIQEWRRCETHRDRWALTPRMYILMTRQLVHVGEPDIAHDVASAGLLVMGRNPELLRWQSLALVNTGAAHHAFGLLGGLLDSEKPSAATSGLAAAEAEPAPKKLSEEEIDTIGFRGGAALEFAHQTEGRLQVELLRKAREDFHAAAGSKTFGYLFKSGEACAARLLNLECETIAREAVANCESIKAGLGAEGDHYLLDIHLGEMSLVLGKFSQALEHYRNAALLARRRYGLIRIAARMASWLMKGHDFPERTAIAGCFELPNIVVFAGQCFSSPGEADPRFSIKLEETVRESILKTLMLYGDIIGYSSATAGADIIFLEVMQSLGRDTYIILPYGEKKFREDTLQRLQVFSPDWKARFEKVLGRAVEVVDPSPLQRQPDNLSHVYANQVLMGLAEQHARHFGTKLRRLAVWDCWPARELGSTASVVQMWVESRRRFKTIDLTYLSKLQSKGQPAREDASKPAGAAMECFSTGFAETATSIKALLFADVRGFSKMSEEQLPLFVQHFLGGIRDRLPDESLGPITARTAGDGLYLVFNSCRAAGNFALEMTRFCQDPKISELLKMPVPSSHEEGLGIRVALHAGAVYGCIDPLMEQYGYTGQHVSHTARLEPVTQVNSVYTTREFAALAAVEGVTEFACDYIGRIYFAKKHGKFPAYVLRKVVKMSPEPVEPQRKTPV